MFLFLLRIQTGDGNMLKHLPQSKSGNPSTWFLRWKSVSVISLLHHVGRILKLRQQFEISRRVGLILLHGNVLPLCLWSKSLIISQASYRTKCADWFRMNPFELSLLERHSGLAVDNYRKSLFSGSIGINGIGKLGRTMMNYDWGTARDGCVATVIR